MKRGIAVALAASMAAALFAIGALAARTEVSSAITLSNGEPTIYEGSVQSSRRACERRRRVKIFHDQNRNGVDPSDYPIGIDKTDKMGNYEVEGSQAPMGDRIVAQLKQRTLPDGTVCLSKERAAVALAG
jgi:hypothetical protein